MRILAINGSARGGTGFTRVCLDRIAEGALSAGAVFETVNLSEMAMRPCVGCQVCHTESHYLKCIYDEADDVRGVFEKMKAADLIVYATPVYLFAMSGLLKNFLDRLNATGDTGKMTLSKQGLMFHHIDRAICSKPFMTLICCDNMENETVHNAASYFRTFSRFMDAEQVGTVVRKSGRLIGHGKDPEKERAYPRMADVYQALYDTGVELAIQGRVSRRTQKRASRQIVPIPLVVEHLMGLPWIKRAVFRKASELERQASGV